MSIIEKMSKIINDGDTAAADQLIHDDYQFLMHSSKIGFATGLLPEANFFISSSL